MANIALINSIGLILLLSIIAFFLYRKYRKKKNRNKKGEEALVQAIEIYKEAERRYEEQIKNGIKTNPHKILWDIAEERGRYNQEGNNPSTRSETIETNSELTKPIGDSKSGEGIIRETGEPIQGGNLQIQSSDNGSGNKQINPREHRRLKIDWPDFG